MGKATNQFSEHILGLLDSDVTQVDGNRFYVALSKSDAWLGNAIAPVDDSLYSQKIFRNKMQSVKRVSAATYVVPRVNWVTSTAYESYDDTKSKQTNFYVMNSSFEVFVCVEAPSTIAGTTVSTVEPTKALSLAAHVNNPAKSFKTSDGYIWRYLYTLSSYARANFLSSDWMPVKTITSQNPSIEEEVEQLALQDSAVAGEILGVKIIDGGSGYSSNPTVSISPSTSTAAFTASYDAGAGDVFKINLDTDGSGLIAHGGGISELYASASITGNANVQAIQGPIGGLNNNPVVSLKANSLLTRSVINGDEDGILRIGNDYKQYGLILNPTQYGSSTPFSANEGNALKGLTVNDTSNLVLDDVISQSSGTISGVSVDKTATQIYYFQTDSTGYEPFVNGTISYQVAPDRTVSGTINPDVDTSSGKILYIGHSDELSGVTRGSAQSDEIRIIINLEDCE